MTNREIDAKVAQAFEGIVPDMQEKILEHCFESKETIKSFSNEVHLWVIALRRIIKGNCFSRAILAKSNIANKPTFF